MKKANYTVIHYFINDQTDQRKKYFNCLLKDYLIKSTADNPTHTAKTKP